MSFTLQNTRKIRTSAEAVFKLQQKIKSAVNSCKR